MDKLPLTKNKHKFYALFCQSTFLTFDADDSTLAAVSIDIETFLNNIKKELPLLHFSRNKHAEAIEHDRLRLYTVDSWPTDPDIEIQVLLYLNPDSTYFLEAIR